MKQIWGCRKCGTERQWGAIPFLQAQQAARESGEYVETEPNLGCLTCDEATAHVYTRDDYAREDYAMSASR